MITRFWSLLTRKPHIVTACLVGLALVLRIPQLTGSFWMDEAAQVFESIRPFSQQLQIKDDFQPPLLHLLLHFAIQVSHAEWWLRWWGALLPALFTIGLMPSLATALFANLKTSQERKLSTEQLVGWLTMLWLATGSFHVFFSQELRPYSLAAFWVVLSWWLLLAKKPIHWFVLASIAGLYSTYLYPFALLGQFFYLFWWSRKAWKQHLMAAFLISLGFLPWFPSFLGQLGAGQQLRTDLPGWENVVATSQLKIFPLVFGKWLFGISDLELTWPWLTAIALFGGLVFILLFNAWQRTGEQKSLADQAHKLIKVVVSWGIVPLLFAWLISFVVPVIQPKRVLWLWPLAALGLSWLIATGWHSKHTINKFAAGALFCLLLASNSFGLYDYYTNPKIQREDWRGLQQQLAKQYSPANTIIVFAFPSPFASWRWYDQEYFPTISTGYLTNQTLDYTHKQLTEISDYQFVLVVDYLRTLTDPQNLILQSLESAGYKGVGTIDTNFGFVRIHARGDALLSSDTIKTLTSYQRDVP